MYTRTAKPSKERNKEIRDADANVLVFASFFEYELKLVEIILMPMRLSKQKKRETK